MLAKKEISWDKSQVQGIMSAPDFYAHKEHIIKSLKDKGNTALAARLDVASVYDFFMAKTEILSSLEGE